MASSNRSYVRSPQPDLTERDVHVLPRWSQPCAVLTPALPDRAGCALPRWSHPLRTDRSRTRGGVAHDCLVSGWGTLWTRKKFTDWIKSWTASNALWKSATTVKAKSKSSNSINIQD